MHVAWLEEPGRKITQCCVQQQQQQQVDKTITHQLLIFFLRIHYTCLQPRGQTKTAAPDNDSNNNNNTGTVWFGSHEN